MTIDSGDEDILLHGVDVACLTPMIRAAAALGRA